MLLTSLAATRMYNDAKKAASDNADPIATTNPVKVTISPQAVVILLVLFLIEFALFIWSIVLAWRCGKRHQDLFIHVVFAFFFPIIYIFYYFMTGCGSFMCQ